jgi:hypothetical protein
MDEDLSALLKIVQEEIDLYRELIGHAREKTSLLVRGHLGAILESNKVDETFSVKLRMLEDELARLSLQVCQKFHIKREEFTLLKLAEGADPSLAEELKSQSTLFKNLVDQLKKVNQRNRKLVESSLSYSRGLIDFISNATSSYQNSGLLKPLSTMQSTISSRA